jgi:hypothetical protein
VAENPLASWALFSKAEIQLSEKVSTQAVTLSRRPVLLINAEFCRRHLESENDLKAVLLHEFLHVLLRHTDSYKFNTPLLNMACDAIINAIIHRSFGRLYSVFFERFYPENGLGGLLRPHPISHPDADLREIHGSIYRGKIAADDLHELLVFLESRDLLRGFTDVIFLGSHGNSEEELSEENRELLEDILRKMDGVGIWNRPGERGFGTRLHHEETLIARNNVEKWRKTTSALLRDCFTPDPLTRNSFEEKQVLLPFVHQGDKKSLSRFYSSNLIPFSAPQLPVAAFRQNTSVYLDVSGSMDAVLEELTALLYSFRSCIKNPLWVFSDDVYRARFTNGKLCYSTSSGTRIDVVFAHIREHKIRKALIVTDGFVETITPRMTEGIDKKNIRVLVSNGGNVTEFQKNGFRYNRLNTL